MGHLTEGMEARSLVYLWVGWESLKSPQESGRNSFSIWWPQKAEESSVVTLKSSL